MLWLLIALVVAVVCVGAMQFVVWGALLDVEDKLDSLLTERQRISDVMQRAAGGMARARRFRNALDE